MVIVGLIFGVGAWEFWHMFKKANYSPNRLLIILGAISLALSRVVTNQDISGLVLSAFVLASMAAHVYAYDHGVDTAGLDFCFTLGGIIYVGWLGSYVMALRFLPDGLYWVLLAILGVSFSDIGAYFWERCGGDTKSPRESARPNRWKDILEGYSPPACSDTYLAAWPLPILPSSPPIMDYYSHWRFLPFHYSETWEKACLNGNST